MPTTTHSAHCTWPNHPAHDRGVCIYAHVLVAIDGDDYPAQIVSLARYGRVGIQFTGKVPPLHSRHREVLVAQVRPAMKRVDELAAGDRLTLIGGREVRHVLACTDGGIASGFLTIHYVDGGKSCPMLPGTTLEVAAR